MRGGRLRFLFHNPYEPSIDSVQNDVRNLSHHNDKMKNRAINLSSYQAKNTNHIQLHKPAQI